MCMYVICMCMYVHICACIFAAKSARSVDTYTYSNRCTYMQHTVIIGKSYAHHMHNIWTYTYPCMHFTHGLRCKGGLNVSACIWLYPLLQRCCSAVVELLQRCCSAVAALLHQCCTVVASLWMAHKNVAATLVLYEKNNFKLLFPKKIFGCAEDLLIDDDRMGLGRGRWNGWYCFAEPGLPGPLARLFDQALWPGPLARPSGQPN